MKVVASSFRLQTPSWINKTHKPFQGTAFSKLSKSQQSHHNPIRLNTKYSPPMSAHAATSKINIHRYHQIEDVGDDGTMTKLLLSMASVMKPALHFQGILSRLHFTSFCCLFQHMIFSCTPALTVPVMLILLATLPTSDLSLTATAILPEEDGCSTSSVTFEEEEEEEEEREGEAMARKRITEEATRLVAKTRHKALMDQETLRRFVSPLTVVEVEEGISDHEEAECEVKKKLAEGYAEAEAEVLSEYANFLWLVKKDLGAAEEMYLEAIAADPSNTTHAANYAHFLWNTGGEDTCYPLEEIDEGREFG